MLTRRPVEVPPAGQTVPDLDVLETMLWSESPLLEVDDGHGRRPVSHGQLINLAAAGPHQPLPNGWPGQLVEVVRELIDCSA